MIADNKVQSVLNRLHNDAQNDRLIMAELASKAAGGPLTPTDFSGAYLPIGKEQGEDIRNWIVEHKCKHIVEFGTSFGISTIYMADAAKEIDGQLITTELLPSKVEIAKRNVAESGLSTVVEFRVGDAMSSLKDLNTEIDFLFLDGWKDLYLPLFQMLEPLLSSGALIYSDNMDMAGTKDYADYILNRSETYSTELVHQGKGFLSKKLLITN